MKPVWIVDDDRSIRWVLEKALSREGIPYKSFASATEAISQLQLGVEPPQVLMSDIRMPGQSGLELLQEVKTRFPSVPVIIITAYSDLESAVAAFQGGAFEYLPKPFDVEQAIELIRRAIDESMHQSGAPEEGRLGAGNSRSGAGHAGSLPRHWSSGLVACHGIDHRRIRFRQGTGCPGFAPAQSACRQGFHCDQYGGDSERLARIRAIWP